MPDFFLTPKGRLHQIDPTIVAAGARSGTSTNGYRAFVCWRGPSSVAKWSGPTRQGAPDAGAWVDQREVSERLRVNVRQFERFVRTLKAEGRPLKAEGRRWVGFPSGGRPASRCLRAALRSRMATRLQDQYADFRSTPAAENLSDTEGITVSAATPRQVQIRLGLEAQDPPGTMCFRSVAGPGTSPHVDRVHLRCDGSFDTCSDDQGLFSVNARDAAGTARQNVAMWPSGGRSAPRSFALLGETVSLIN